MADAEDIRNKFDETRNKSEDDFEKSLTYISGGALGLSLTFMEKIISLESSLHIWTLIFGWIFLGLTLMLNLVSHLITSYYSRISQDEYDSENKDEELIIKKIKKRNRNITIINWTTVSFLMIGISFIIIFSSINYTNKTHSSHSDNCTNTHQEKSLKKCCEKESQTIIENNPVFINNIGKTDTTITKKHNAPTKKYSCRDSLNKYKELWQKEMKNQNQNQKE